MRIQSFYNSKTLATRLADDKSGSIAVTFAIAIFVIFLAVGSAIDYARAAHARQKVGAALDAATIAAARRLKDGTLTNGEIQLYASNFFEKFLANGSKIGVTNNFQISINPTTNTVMSSVDTVVPTAFVRAAGLKTINFPTNATAVFNSQDIEVALQLDVTGSMSQTVAGTTKIASLKAATNDLIDILLPDSGTGTTKVRLGIAPFGAGVNAGTYANAITGSSSNPCAYERLTASYDTTDVEPAGLDRLKSKSDLSGGAQNCPSSAEVMPITADKAKLKTAVNGLTTGGSTAGHLGTAFAWYLISPNWGNIWPTASKPASYADTNTRKIAILMTDGLYNTVGGINSGANTTDSANKARALCTKMRDQGVVIYTVGFIKAGDDPRAADTLKECTGTNGTFYQAADGDQLRTAFKSIAQDISRLRLSQ